MSAAVSAVTIPSSPSVLPIPHNFSLFPYLIIRKTLEVLISDSVNKRSLFTPSKVSDSKIERTLFILSQVSSVFRFISFSLDVGNCAALLSYRLHSDPLHRTNNLLEGYKIFLADEERLRAVRSLNLLHHDIEAIIYILNNINLSKLTKLQITGLKVPMDTYTSILHRAESLALRNLTVWRLDPDDSETEEEMLEPLFSVLSMKKAPLEQIVLEGIDIGAFDQVIPGVWPTVHTLDCRELMIKNWDNEFANHFPNLVHFALPCFERNWSFLTQPTLRSLKVRGWAVRYDELAELLQSIPICTKLVIEDLRINDFVFCDTHPVPLMFIEELLRFPCLKALDVDFTSHIDLMEILDRLVVLPKLERIRLVGYGTWDLLKLEKSLEKTHLKQLELRICRKKGFNDCFHFHRLLEVEAGIAERFGIEDVHIMSVS